MFKIVVVIAIFFMPLLATANVQQKRQAYGPVVRAYLTGLDEELTELEFQFRHQEISREVYGRTKQRLVILRRYVEAFALREREDRVPELQVLADDELGILVPDAQLNPDELKIEDEIGGKWKLVSIERGRNRFFVLEKLQQFDAGGTVPERKLGSGIDPLDVIETIIVREEAPEHNQPKSKTVEAESVTMQATPASAPPGDSPQVDSKPRHQNLRLLHIYLPEYTSKARDKHIEGELIVSALFQSDGRIKKVKVEKGLGYGLDERAVEAVKRLGFLPAEIDGQPVDSTAQIVFGFNLNKVTIYVGAAELMNGDRL